MSVGSIHLHALPYAWPVLWPLLEKAARRTPDMPEVRPLVESGHAQLWAIVENGRPVAAVTTQITLEPEKRCRIWLVGGSRVREWVGVFLEKLTEWARGYGCVALWARGRRGWDRLGEELGFQRVGAEWERRI